jgi:hypothetical protein
MDHQLAFDIGVAAATDGAPPTQRWRPRTEGRGHLSSLAQDAERADPGVPMAQVLVQLLAAVEAALAVSVSDAYRQHRSWRRLSTELGIPFQTLHRRYADEVETA